MQYKTLLLLAMTLAVAGRLKSQDNAGLQELKESVKSSNESLDHRLDQLAKMVDDVLWQQKTGDIAWMDKLYIYGPPPWKIKNRLRWAQTIR